MFIVSYLIVTLNNQFNSTQLNIVSYIANSFALTYHLFSKKF